MGKYDVDNQIQCCSSVCEWQICAYLDDYYKMSVKI